MFIKTSSSLALLCIMNTGTALLELLSNLQHIAGDVICTIV